MILNYFNITFANNLQLFFFSLYSLSQSSLLTIICVKFPNLSKYRLDGREWSIQTRYSHTGALYLSGGWPGFVVDMNLDRGDICIFELIKMDDAIMKVSVFSASKECK